MRMQVVRVRHMRMTVPRRLVHMRVAVRALREGIVRVHVVPVVVAVGMLVLEPLVLVFMAVGFRQVQQHAQGHQHAASQHDPGGRSVDEGK